MRRLFARLIILLLLASLVLPLVLEEASGASRIDELIAAQLGQTDTAPPVVHVAQRKRRTLLDLLFGNDEPEPQPQPQVQAPVQQAPKKPRVRVAEPPPPPKVEKAPTATRLAVFGDSLAIDLFKALDRFYAEDPNLVVINKASGDSGFVRQDFFDWNATLDQEIAANSFDVAVVLVGINDRQTVYVNGESYKSLTPEWTQVYQDRINTFASKLRAANKPAVWVGLPPMSKSEYSAAMSQISAMYRLAAFAGGLQFLDIYERFLDEEGKYSSYGPDLNGQRVRMRKDDGIHFSTAGADKLAFYVTQALKLYYRGGVAVGFEVADPLAGTDAQLMLRPPYQGLGQIRLLEVAGAVIPLSHATKRAVDLVTADAAPQPADDAASAFDIAQMVEAPVGRVDSFGAGIAPPTSNPGGR